MNFKKIVLFSLISFLASNCKKNGSDSSSEPLFTLLSAEKTKVNFQNIISEGLNTNVLMYEYFYNGGGVAVADLNGDGLEDLYFTSNMQTNKLYLNKGKMEFQDISSQAGVAGREGPWKTGATIVDINGDGKLDIFVCYSGNMRPEKRTKQLFINEGNDAAGVPRFVDKAFEYGLDNVSTSTQASFFDYDKDGDLDMFLLNHNIKSLPVLNILSTAEILKVEDQIAGSRLFRQVQKGGQPFFEDVTKAAGISSSSLSYGLGVGVADLNQDGWQDLYISNDYTVPDYLYINNQKGGFTNQINERLGHFSQFSMGNDISDINNDGKMDIFTLDMLPEENRRQKLLMAPDNYEKFDFNVQVGFGHQYMRNMLHLNDNSSNKTVAKSFSEIGQIAGISNTDWSWAALFADYDNDGWKDLYITNGYVRDYTNLDFLKYMNDFTTQNQGNMNRESVMQLITQMPSSNVTNYIFKNNGDLTFKNQVANWGTNQTSNSTGAAYADLDNDGDLDLVVNNTNQTAFIYQNESNAKNHFLKVKLNGEGLNKNGVGAKVTLYNKGKIQFAEAMPTHGYQSSVSPILHFGLGESASIDSLSVIWISGRTEVIRNIKSNQQIELVEKNGKNTILKNDFTLPIFEEIVSPIVFQDNKNTVNDFKRQSLMLNPASNSGPCMAKADINQDGLEDVFVGGGTGQTGQIFIQNKSGGFANKPQKDFDIDKASSDSDAKFFDANGDGFLDLYVASGGYGLYQPNDVALQDRLYLNDGKANFKKSTNALPSMIASKGCIEVIDANADGKPDLFVGGRISVGSYPETPQSYVLINNGNGQFTDKTPENLKRIGMVSDAVYQDLDGDKVNELIITGEWMSILIFKVEKGNFTDISDTYFDKKYNGLWNKILVEDFNKDGIMDLIVGNFGQNSQLKVTDDEPVEVYFKDFDKNGSVEPILTSYIQGRSFPYLTRDELIEQLPLFRAKFTDYKSYSEASINEVFAKGELDDAGHFKANCLKTMLFEGTKSKKFKEKTLPIETQFSPIFTINSIDFDADGNQDLLLAGNIHQARLKFGNYDANQGILLRNDGKGNFKTMKNSNLNLTGDIRSAVFIKNQLYIGQNQGKLRSFKFIHKKN